MLRQSKRRSPAGNLSKTQDMRSPQMRSLSLQLRSRWTCMLAVTVASTLLGYPGIQAASDPTVLTSQLPALRALATAFPVNNNTWRDSVACSKWWGVSCDKRGAVTRIALSLYDLESPPSLPSQIGSLNTLTALQINGGLSGALPASIRSLSNLESLDLTFNSLSGAISFDCSRTGLRSLKVLSLNFNSLSGRIPSALSTCTRLENLLLGSNKLTGTIPNIFANMRSLRALDLSSNSLFGAIPASLTTPPSLWFLDVSDNQLSGTPPSNFVSSNIGSINGTYRIRGNFFSGSPVPTANKGKSWFCPMLQQGGYALINLADFGCAFLSSEASNCFSTSTDPWINLPSTRLTAGASMASVVASLNSKSKKKVPAGQLKKWGELVTSGKITALMTGPWGKGRRRGFRGDYANTGNSTCFTESQRPLAQCAAFCNAYNTRVCGGLGSCFLNSTEGGFVPNCLCTPPAFQTFDNTSRFSTFDATTKQSVPFFPTCARSGRAFLPPGQRRTNPSGRFKTGLLVESNPSSPTNKFNKYFRHLSVGFIGSYSRPTWSYSPSIDWRSNLGAQKQSAVTAVRDQGLCGSCWVFSAVGAVESALAIAGRSLPPDISEQQVLDCLSAGSCLGGQPADALNYFAYASPGVNAEASYPYLGTKGTCRVPSTSLRKLLSLKSRILKKATPSPPPPSSPTLTPQQSVSGSLGPAPTQPYITQMYEQAPSSGWFGILQAVQIQPAIADLEADQLSFLLYPGGYVYNDPDCFANQMLTHSVLVVGYDVTAPVPFWILKNSWGTNWGEAGYMRLAISGGVGVCGINYTPVRYPVVKGSDPCGPINPCGGGTCVATGQSYVCNRCPPNFMPVTNLDGSQTCGPVLVCNLFDSNPCGVGTCVDDGAGSYNCICPPPSYTYGLTTESTPTCIPGNATSTLTAKAGMTCDLIRTMYGLNRTAFASQNPSLNCQGKLTPGTVINVANPQYKGCKLYYSVSMNDSCSSIETLFSVTLASLNPDLDCGSLSIGQQVCVEAGTPVIYLCQDLYNVAPGDSCSSIALNVASPPLTPQLFYAYNPGIVCANLQPGVTGSTVVTQNVFGTQVCVAAEPRDIQDVLPGALSCRYGTYTVITGDSCLRVYSKVYCNKATLFTKYNLWACVNSKLWVGRPLCRPARTSTGVCY